MEEQRRGLTKRDLERMLSTAIADHSVSRPGERESDVLEVRLTLHTGRRVHLVAKVLPEAEAADAGGRLRGSLCLRREMDVHLLVVPECRAVQEDRLVRPRDRLDVFCRCVAARATRLGAHDDEGQLAGEDSVLLLEDLKTQGYVPGDAASGLDLKETEFVVTQLARFHATAVAVRIAKPLVFRNKVIKALAPLRLGHRDADGRESRVESCLEVLRQSSEFSDYIGKIAELFNGDAGELCLSPAEPFATVVHNDFRTTNMMFKYDYVECGERRITDFKIVNFGNACYGSPASDLVLFLFASAKSLVVSEHLDRLLRLYHDTFVGSLGRMKFSVERFSFENFVKELSMFAAYQLPRIFSCLFTTVKSSKETEKNFVDYPSDHDLIHDESDFFQRTLQIMKLFDAKGWL